MKKNQRRWKKSWLTILGITIGVCAVVVVNAIGLIGTDIISVELQGMGLGGIIISHAETGKPLSEKEIRIMQNATPVRYVMPLTIVISAYNTAKGAGSALVFGVDEGVGNVISFQITEGRAITTRDLKENKNVCIVDEKIVNKTENTSNLIGSSIPLNINNNMVEFTIIGIAKSGSGMLQNMLGEYLPSFVYVPYTTLQNLCKIDKNQQVIVQMNDPKFENSEEYLVRLLEHQTGKKDGYLVQSLSQQEDSLNNILNIISGVLTIIGGISLMVACLNIMTTMLVSVRERTREIGIKKSIGASSHRIMLEFLMEAAKLSISGATLGIILGLAIVIGIESVMQIKPILPLTTCIYTFFVTIFSGMLFGAYPAYRAASMIPIDALKTD